MLVSKIFWFILCALLAYLVTFAFHGYAHAIVAFLYGQNDVPWVIVHGNLWLQNAAENVEYHDLLAQDELLKAGIIAISGTVVNWILLGVAVLRIMHADKPRRWITFYYFLAVWNLTAVFNYVPLHVLEPSTELNHVFREVGISIWMFYFIGGVASLGMIYILFFRTLYQVLELSNIRELWLRWVYFLIPLFIVIFYSTCRYICTSWGLYKVIFDITIWVKLFALVIIIYASDINTVETGV